MGKKVGLSPRSAEKAAKVGGVIGQLRAEGKEADAADLESALNKGYDTAHKLAIKNGHIAIKKTAKKAKDSARIKSEAEAPGTIITPEAEAGENEVLAAPAPAAANSTATEEVASEPSDPAPLTPPPPPQSTPKTKTKLKLDSDTALERLDEIFTFLRSSAQDDFSSDQKQAWKKLLNQIYARGRVLGI